MPFFIIFIQCNIWSHSPDNKASKRKERHPNQREKSKTIIICRWHDPIDPNDSTKRKQWGLTNNGLLPLCWLLSGSFCVSSLLFSLSLLSYVLVVFFSIIFRFFCVFTISLFFVGTIRFTHNILLKSSKTKEYEVNI